MGWLSVFSALARLPGSLTGIYRDSRLRVGPGLGKPVWPPSKLDRLGPNGWRKSLPIWTLLMTMNLISACTNINAPADGCEWIRPIIVAEADKLTTATKRALLAHNELYEEFCRHD